MSFHDEANSSRVDVLMPCSCLCFGRSHSIGYTEFLEWWSTGERRWQQMEHTEEEMQKLQQAVAYFDYFDKDKSGSISEEEFVQLHANLVENGLIVPSLDKTDSTARIDSYREMDKTGEGGIDFNEYGGAACALLPQNITTHAQLLLVFGVVHSGLAVEQRSVLRRRGAGQTKHSPRHFAVYVASPLVQHKQYSLPLDTERGDRFLPAPPRCPVPPSTPNPHNNNTTKIVRAAAPRQLPCCCEGSGAYSSRGSVASARVTSYTCRCRGCSPQPRPSVASRSRSSS